MAEVVGAERVGDVKEPNLGWVAGAVLVVVLVTVHEPAEVQVCVTIFVIF